MARHQVWDKDGKLIIDEEVPDVLTEEEARKQQILMEFSAAATVDEKLQVLLKALGLLS